VPGHPTGAGRGRTVRAALVHTSAARITAAGPPLSDLSASCPPPAGPTPLIISRVTEARTWCRWRGGAGADPSRREPRLVDPAGGATPRARAGPSRPALRVPQPDTGRYGASGYDRPPSPRSSERCQHRRCPRRGRPSPTLARTPRSMYTGTRPPWSEHVAGEPSLTRPRRPTRAQRRTAAQVGQDTPPGRTLRWEPPAGVPYHPAPRAGAEDGDGR